MELKFDQQFVYKTIEEIMAIDSPSGFTKAAVEYVESVAKQWNLPFSWTRKGNGIITMEGKDSSRCYGVCAHVDTLGLMVRSIKANGHLSITRIGGPLLPTLDSELCKVYTRDGKVYDGTIFCTSPAAHVYPDSRTKERDENGLEVILDEKVKNKADVEALGICAGDFICYTPKTVITPSGFIKSRFLDDKLSVAIILGVIKYMVDNNIQPEYTIKFIMSTYEEVGHGMSYIPEDIEELLCIDMGCIGLDLNCTEFDVSICAKDSGGPYNYEMTSKIINLAKENNLQYAVDIYPMYGSDAGASLRAGHDIRAALIGAGVFASHGYERTHWEAVDNSMKLLYFYVTQK